jgi:hypothetical protein
MAELAKWPRFLAPEAAGEDTLRTAAGTAAPPKMKIAEKIVSEKSCQ